MNTFKKRHSGFSIIEMLLVLVIGGSLLTLGFRQYQAYKMDSDLRRVLYNVDQLAQAASFYYFANCGNQSDPGTNTSVPGTLSPWRNPAPNPNFSINIINDLLNRGYLTRPIMINPLVNSSAAGGGYSVQLNQSSTPRMVLACSTPGCTPQPTQIGTTIDWKIQIGVTFNSAAIANSARAYLGATCLSTTNANTNSVVSCGAIGTFTANCINWRLSGGALNTATANANGCPNSTSTTSYQNYIVFERSPHFYAERPQDGLWSTRALAKKYYQEQTSYPITYLLTNQHNPEYQYFLCGS
jgi:prepilin-type N-terminal cleavage/methylation domain-containing protein